MDNKSMHTIDMVSGATVKIAASGTVGAAVTPTILGHTAAEWQVIGIILGFVIGILSIIVNNVVRIAISRNKL